VKPSLEVYEKIIASTPKSAFVVEVIIIIF
jgi:hypothetical protein